MDNSTLKFLFIKWDQERNGIFINHETKYRHEVFVT